MALAIGTIKSVVDDATQCLAGTISETPRLDAEVLMAFTLGWPRSRLLAHWDERLSPSDQARFDGYVSRRARGEPVAYIRHLKEFLGLELYVDERVLIPRPETELLVQLATTWLRDHGPCRVVDLGTGSGAIAIGILSAYPDARVIATDASAEALQVAELNAARHGVKLELRYGHLLEPIEGPIDLVVANLPYLSQAEFDLLQHTSIGFEPRMALTDGGDGRRLFDELFVQMRERDVPAVLLEVGSQRVEPPSEYWATFHPDYAGLPRVLELNRR